MIARTLKKILRRIGKKKVTLRVLAWTCNVLLWRRDFLLGIPKVECFPLALVIVDMQEEFLRKLSWFQRRRLVAKTKKVAKFFIKQGWTIFVLEYQDSGSTIEPVKRILDGYSLEKCFFIEKPKDNGLIKTPLRQLLRSNEIKGVVLAGLNANGCVFQTARSAEKLGLSLLTAREIIDDEKGNIPHAWYVQKTELYCFRLKKLISVVSHSMEY